jgi:hypothetical protein
VWGSESGNVYVVGAGGTILHYDSTAWSFVTTGANPNFWLNDIWGSSATDLFAVGADLAHPRGAILHYNGAAWQAMESDTSDSLSGVWGSSATDVYAVGSAGVIVHYNGAAWQSLPRVTTSSLFDIWGASASDIFAVGGAGVGPPPDTLTGTIIHYDGTAWRTIVSDAKTFLFDVWGSGAEDVFAVGDQGTILHYDGQMWRPMPSGTARALFGVWGSGADNVFAVGDQGVILHYDGAAWSTMASGTVEMLSSIWGSGAEDVFAVGGNGDVGTILHYDGATWDAMASDAGQQLFGIWGNGAGSVFAVGPNSMILGYVGKPPHLHIAETLFGRKEVTSTLPVFLRSNGNSIAAADFALRYDPACLQVDNAEAIQLAQTSPTPGEADFRLGEGTGVEHAGRLRMIVEQTGKNPASTLRDGILVTVVMARSGPCLQTRIDFTDVLIEDAEGQTQDFAIGGGDVTFDPLLYLPTVGR